jgi:uncharacterized membrane protein YGL010W
VKKIDSLLNEYGESHKNKTNKLIHWICVPAIFFSIVGLVWSIPLGPLKSIRLAFILASIEEFQYVNWATITLCLIFIYYIYLSIRLTFGMIFFSIGCLYLCKSIENLILSKFINIELWVISLFIFVIAWIFQFIGHKIEGKKPSFLKDIQFLLIGPAWLMHFIYKKLNIKY